MARSTPALALRMAHRAGGDGHARGDRPERRLTARQAQMVELAAAGITDKEIAARLGLSVRTVHKRLERAYRRLGVANRTAAAHLIGGVASVRADGSQRAVDRRVDVASP